MIHRSMSAMLSALAVLVVIASTGSIPVSGQPETPRYGGTLVKSDLYGDPRTLDPLLVSRLGATMVAMHIFDGLVKLDGERGVVVPDIAERWTTNPDGKTYTFYLRKGVLFHDGTEVTAADFKYQLERVGNPDNLSPSMPRLAGVVGLKEFQERRAREIEGIKAPDRYILQISLTRPNALLPYYLSGVWASAVRRGHPCRSKPEFSWPGGAAANPQLGLHAEPRPGLHLECALDDLLSRIGHFCGHSGAEPVG